MRCSESLENRKIENIDYLCRLKFLKKLEKGNAAAADVKKKLFV
jgi:hypothetical protein